jgi:iron complex outermembrane receptor protein
VKRLLACTLLASTVAGVSAVPAVAQDMNYAGLQDVLGEPVTTSVTGKPQRASEVPASMTIITRAEIMRSGARDVPGLLRLFAGVEVNRWTAGQSDVAVRGGVQTYNARLLVLVNGRQVYLDHYGMTDWSLLGVPLEAVQQIELVRGPASALFGFNAADGVVNIVTTDPQDGPHAAATVEGGNHDQRRVGGSVTLPIGGDVGLQLSGEHRQEQERAIPAGLYQPTNVSGVRSDDAQGRLSADLNAGTSVTLAGGWAMNRQLEFLPSQLLTEQRFRSENVGATIDHDTGWGSVSGRAYTNWLSTVYGISPPPGVIASADDDLRFQNRITVVQGSTLVRLDERNTLRLGLEYRDNQLRSADLFSDRVGYGNAAASLMVDLHPTDRLALSLAGRVDRLRLEQCGTVQQPAVNSPEEYRRKVTSPSFNAGLLYQVGASGQFRLNGGRGLQSPSLADFGSRLTLTVPGSPLAVLIAGDPSLRPATVWSGELGYDQQLGGNLKIGGTAFLHRTSDVIASPGSNAIFNLVARPMPLLVARFANIGAFSSYGVEIAASGSLTSRLSWHANYSWTHVDAHLRNGGAALTYAFAPKATTPAHVGNLTLAYVAQGWSALGNAHVMARTRQFAFLTNYSLALTPVPAAVALDAKVERRLTARLSLFVAGENLGRARGAYGSPLPGDRRVRAGARITL